MFNNFFFFLNTISKINNFRKTIFLNVFPKTSKLSIKIIFFLFNVFNSNHPPTPLFFLAWFIFWNVIFQKKKKIFFSALSSRFIPFTFVTLPRTVNYPRLSHSFREAYIITFYNTPWNFTLWPRERDFSRRRWRKTIFFFWWNILASEGTE